MKVLLARVALRPSRIARILFTAFALAGAAPAAIDLGDIVAGGDGTGTAPAGNTGIDPRDGQFRADAPENGYSPGFPNPSPTASDLIDSVFILGPATSEPWPQPITQSGATFELPAADAPGQGYNYILKDANGGVPGPIVVGGLPFTKAIGIHSAMGITFSLSALRAAHGDAAIGCFTTYWGMDEGAGDVNLHAVLSDDAGTLDSRSFHAGGANVGELVQMEIPAEAEYLTLIVGSNGSLCCDHGTFGAPTITPAPCGKPGMASLSVLPPAVTINPGMSLALHVWGTDELGVVSDISAAAAGTVYAIDQTDIADVDADGILTAFGEGTALLEVTNGAASATVTVFVRDFIDLGNIAAGGDGKAEVPFGNIGIEAGTGRFVQARHPDTYPDSDGINPQPIDGSGGAGDSLFIDCVFYIQGASQVITTLGDAFDFDPADVSNGWEAILQHREPDGPDYLKFADRGPFYDGLGMHAAQGITYDLDFLRSEFGDEAVGYVSAVAGSTAGAVTAYFILVGGGVVLASDSAPGLGWGGNRLMELAIPPDASFLTLAVGAYDGTIGGDHGGFGLARITPRSLTEDLAGLSLLPAAAILRPGETAALAVSGTPAWPGLEGFRLPVDPAAATFSSADPSVAEVDAAGTITGKAAGTTTVTVTIGTASRTAPVTVMEYLNLADVTAGGDGSGNAPPENRAIDPRDGSFLTFTSEEGVTALGPDPVPTSSPYVDSVFIIGRGFEGAEIHEQAITQSRVTFPFPGADAFGSGYNFILKDSNGGIAGLPITVGGMEFITSVGIHAAMGITYDLEAIRAIHGDEAVGRFTTYWGMDEGPGDCNLHAILSDDQGVLEARSFRATQDAGELLEVDIPREALYLTLASGSNSLDAGGLSSDHGTFANAFILPAGGPPAPRFVRGDPNGDGKIDLSDAIFILSFLFLGGDVPVCRDAADGDDSGILDLTDPIGILGFLFLGGTPPPPPAAAGSSYLPGDCAVDPTDDAIDCAADLPSCK